MDALLDGERPEWLLLSEAGRRFFGLPVLRSDSIFYQLFSIFPSSFFELVGLPVEEARSYRFDSVEVKQTAFRIDGVFLPKPEDSQRPIIFAEVQFQKDPAIYKRLFSEIFLYLRWADTNPDWRAVVVFAKRSIEPDTTTGYSELLNSQNLQRVYLDELADEERTLGIDIIRLVVESEASAKFHASRLVERARRVPDAALGREIVELIETILLYKFPRLTREEIEAMFSVSDLKKTKVYQEALQEGREEILSELGSQRGALSLLGYAALFLHLLALNELSPLHV